MSTGWREEGAARRALQVMEARRGGREAELLHRVCHELLSSAELPIVIRSALDHLADHLGSDVGYLRVVDLEQPNLVLEATRGLAGRHLETVRAWTREPEEHSFRSSAAVRQQRPMDLFARFPIREPTGIEGVLVVDRRPDAGPTALEEKRIILATASLVGDAVRCRRELSRSAACQPGDNDATPSANAAPSRPPDPCEASRASSPGSLKALMLAFERDILVGALRDADGNQSRAARALHTTPRILAYRLKRHGLHGMVAGQGRSTTE